jgi:hypothetical protein
MNHERKMTMECSQQSAYSGTPILPPELDLPLQRMAQEWGLHTDLLRVAAEIIEKQTYFSARAWLRLLRESQDIPENNAMLWRISHQKALLLSLISLPSVGESEKNLLLTLLKQLEVHPQVSAA